MNSLTFLCSQLIFLPGSEAISLCCATAGHGTWHPQHAGMQENIWERGGEKSCQRGESPLLQQTPLGWSLTAFLRAGSALMSCHPYAPEPPQQAVYHQIQVSLPKQPHQSSLSAGVWRATVCRRYCAKPTARAECTGAGLGRMTQLHQKGCSSFPCLLKPSSNTAQAQPVAALLWALSHRNPGKQSGREGRRTALPDLMLQWASCLWATSSHRDQTTGARHWHREGVRIQCRRRAVLRSGTDHEVTVCNPLSGNTPQKRPHALSPRGVRYSRGKGLQVWNHYSFETQTCGKEHSSGCSQHIILFQWHLPSNCWDGL